MAVCGYKITDQGAMYFVSFTVVGWSLVKATIVITFLQ
jgi:hypothetical protein